jgi:hypothetical protein
MDTIGRYNNLIGNKDEKTDLIETFCKNVFDSIQNLLTDYCNLTKFLILEREKNNFPLTERHYYFLNRIFFFNSEFRQIFLFELKDFFKMVKFWDVIEDYVNRCVKKVELGIESLFSQLNSYTSCELNKLLKTIKYKETYHVTSTEDYAVSLEMDRICNFLRPLFITVKLYLNITGYG